MIFFERTRLLGLVSVCNSMLVGVVFRLLNQVFAQ